MNLWALIIIVMGFVAIMVGVKGTQKSVVGMLSGKSGPFANTNLAGFTTP